MAEADYQPSPQSRAVGANELAPPVMPNFQDPGATFLSAFALSAGLAQRRRALELQLAEIQDKSQKDEQNFNLQKQKFAFDQVQETNLNNYRAQELAVRNKAADFSNDLRTQNLQLKQGEIDQLGQLNGAISTLGSKPGDPNFPSDLANLYSQYPAAAYSSAGRSLRSRLEIAHNQKTAGTATAVNTDFNLLTKQLEGYGVPKSRISDLMQQDQLWQPAYDKYGDNGVPAKGAKRTGQFTMVPVIDPNTGMPAVDPNTKQVLTRPVTIPDKDLKEYRNRFDNINRRAAGLGTQITNADTGVGTVPVTSALSDTPIATGGAQPQPKANPYRVGGQYGNMTYNGGDPNDPNSWQQTQ